VPHEPIEKSFNDFDGKRRSTKSLSFPTSLTPLVAHLIYPPFEIRVDPKFIYLPILSVTFAQPNPFKISAGYIGHISRVLCNPSLPLCFDLFQIASNGEACPFSDCVRLPPPPKFIGLGAPSGPSGIV
jgi:hypothetical protein